MANLKPLNNSIHVLIINEDILGSGASAVKMIEKGCKSAQMSTKCLNMSAQVLA